MRLRIADHLALRTPHPDADPVLADEITQIQRRIAQDLLQALDGIVANRLAFNTVARNLIQTSSKSGGIHCDAGANIVGYYNIVWDNNPMAAGDQVTGLYKYTYSDVGPAVLASTIDAGHTLNLNPQIVDEQSDPHLKAASAARGYAPSDADLTGLAAKDIDGDARTAPADLGADQHHGP